MASESPKQGHAVSSELAELAYAILLLERQMEVYQRLHDEDMASLRSTLQEIKKRLTDFSESASVRPHAARDPSF